MPARACTRTRAQTKEKARLLSRSLFDWVTQTLAHHTHSFLTSLFCSASRLLSPFPPAAAFIAEGRRPFASSTCTRNAPLSARPQHTYVQPPATHTRIRTVRVCACVSARRGRAGRRSFHAPTLTPLCRHHCHPPLSLHFTPQHSPSLSHILSLCQSDRVGHCAAQSGSGARGVGCPILSLCARACVGVCGGCYAFASGRPPLRTNTQGDALARLPRNTTFSFSSLTLIVAITRTGGKTKRSRSKWGTQKKLLHRKNEIADNVGVAAVIIAS